VHSAVSCGGYELHMEKELRTPYGYREHGPTIRRFAGGLFRAIWQSPGAHDLG
jgi:hypothetical protein